MSKKDQKKKPIYSTPMMIPLGEMAKGGEGNCRNGDVGGGVCKTGFDGGGACGNGGTPANCLAGAPGCEPGSTPFPSFS